MSKIGYIQRYILLIRKVRNTPYITLKELRQYIEQELEMRGELKSSVSQRTIERDIKEIRTALGISIDYSRIERGYYIPDDEDNVSDLERTIEPFEVLSAMGQDSGLDDFIIPEQRRANGSEHLYRVVYSIRNSHVITFDYKKYWSDDITHRTIMPYALKEARGRWYVVGVDSKDNSLKTFGLDRVVNLEITNSKFKRDNSIDVVEKFRHSFSVDIGSEVEHIVFSVDSNDSGYLKSMLIHSSQQLLSEYEGRSTFSLDLYITPDVVMELISRSWSLKVHKPESLRKRIIEIYQNAIDRNR